jgi:hypothetical protein
MTEEKPEEKKKLSPFTVVGSMGAAALAMIIGARLKTEGTIPGAALGSGVSTVTAFIIETRSRKAHAKLKALREKDKPGAPGTYIRELQDMPLERRLTDDRAKEIVRRTWSVRKRLVLAGGLMVLCMGSAVASLFIIESATGQTLHSVLTNQKQYGTTLGGYSSQKPSPVPVSPRVTMIAPSTESPAGSPSAPFSSTPSLTPSPAQSPTPTPVPDGSPP